MWHVTALLRVQIRLWSKFCIRVSGYSIDSTQNYKVKYDLVFSRTKNHQISHSKFTPNTKFFLWTSCSAPPLPIGWAIFGCPSWMIKSHTSKNRVNLYFASGAITPLGHVLQRLLFLVPSWAQILSRVDLDFCSKSTSNSHSNHKILSTPTQQRSMPSKLLWYVSARCVVTCKKFQVRVKMGFWLWCKP